MDKLKKILGQILLLLFCSLVSYYLTWTIDKITLETDMQFLFVFIYFLVATYIVCLLLKKRIPGTKPKQNVLYLIVSGILSIAIIISCFDFFLGLYKPMKINITAVGTSVEMKEGQKGTEVWLHKVTVNNKQVNLEEILPTEGWENRDGVLLSYQNQPNTLTLEFSNVKNITMKFLSHPWSGTVIVDNGLQKEQLDLFNPDMEGSNVDLTLNGISISSLNDYFISACCFVMLWGIFYTLLMISKKNTGNFLALYFSLFLGLLASVYKDLYFLHNGIILSVLLIAFLLLGYFYTQIKDKLVLNKSSKILLLFVCAIISFQISAQYLFMDVNQTSITLKQLSIYFLVVLIIIPLILLLYYVINKFEALLNKNIWKPNKKVNKKIIVISFVALFFIISGLSYNEVNSKLNVSYRPTEITIRVTGEKNRDSLGYEVLLHESAFINGKSTKIELNGDHWENREGLFWGLQPNSEIRIKFPEAEDIDIQFVKHAYSGIVEIKDGEKIKRLDLFSDSTIDGSLRYNVSSNRVTSKNEINIYSIIISLFIGLFICTIILFFVYATLHETKQWVYNLSIFSMITLVWLLFLYGSNPGGMSVDTISQFSQAKGIIPLSDNHPALLTLYYRLIFNIIDSPLIFSINQIILYAFIIMIYVSYLSKKGLPRKILSVFTIIFALTITNGIYVTILWKDIPYTVFLLWITYLLLKLIIDKETFFSQISNCIQAVLCLTLLPLLRHNGFAVTIIVSIFLLIYSFIIKSHKPTIITVLSIALIIIVKGPVYNYLGVIKNKNTAPTTTMLHSMVYIDMVDEELPNEAEILLDELLTSEDWYKIYFPYSTNSFYLSDIAIRNNLEQKMLSLNTSRVFNAYLKTFIKHPLLTIKDRFYGFNILWNPFGGDNWRAANDEYEQIVINNDFGYFCKENIVTSIIDFLFDKTVSNAFVDSIFWRSAFYISFLLIMLFACIANRKFGFIIISLPVLANCASLVLALNWQDFRYVYFVFAIIGFLTLSYYLVPTVKKE